MLLLRKLQGRVPIGPRDLQCADLYPGTETCRVTRHPASWCVTGDDRLTHEDFVTLRLVSVGVLVPSCAPCAGQGSAAHVAPERAPGDVAPPGGDGVVDVQDVVLMLRWTVGLDVPTPEQRAHGDVAGADGALDVADVVRLLRAAVGLETLEWPEREVVLQARLEGEAVAIAARVEDAPSSAIVVPGCAGSAVVDSGDATLGVSCFTDGAPLQGLVELARVRYRSVAAWRPTAAVVAIDGGWEGVPATFASNEP